MKVTIGCRVQSLNFDTSSNKLVFKEVKHVHLIDFCQILEFPMKTMNLLKITTSQKKVKIRASNEDKQNFILISIISNFSASKCVQNIHRELNT